MKKSSYSTTLTTSEHDGQRNLNGGVLSAGNFDLVVQNGHIAEPSVLGRTSPSAKGIVYHNNFIGGRYSVLSEVGMLPSSLVGLNSKKFKQFNNLVKKKNFITDILIST